METKSLNSSFFQDFPEVDRDKILTSISGYKKAGIEFEVISNSISDVTVIIRQSRLINGLILSNKQLYIRAKEVFADYKVKIKPAVFSLNLDDITPEWVQQRMVEFGIKRSDLIKQIGLDKASLSLYFSSSRGLTQTAKAAFYYYFLVYEINRDLREQKEITTMMQ